MKNLTWIIVACVAVVMTSCNTGEVERLSRENDSLRVELDERDAVVVTLKDIKTLIDSIDASRKVLHADLKEGRSYDEFVTRMRDINDYVAKTERKLDTLQRSLRESQGEASAYMMMVASLKDELTIRADEVVALEKQVEDYRSENKGLVKTVQLQEQELGTLRTQIEAKQQELRLIEAKVEEMVSTFKLTEAEAYFARAKAVEEAANRTRLAPNKKRETYREALELYRKALSLGKEEAKTRITALEKKIR